MKFMYSMDIPDTRNSDDFLKAKTCPICIAIGRKKSREISHKHDTRTCLNMHFIIHYLTINNHQADDKEIRKYTIKCLKELNKYRKSVGKIEI